jgi:hypothetical protein
MNKFQKFQKFMRDLRDCEESRILFIFDCIGYGIVISVLLWVFCSWHDVVTGTNWSPVNIFEVFVTVAEYFKN